MTYELWDTETRNIIGAYPTEADALAVVRAGVTAYGAPYAQPLALLVEGEEEESRTLAAGPDLALRAASAAPVPAPVGP